jgi:uncharacterized membrane protein YsdA (DUF1294 family)
MWLGFINLTGMVAMAYDKSQAESGARRVREMTLWKIALLGGAFGILAAEGLFHHKTEDLIFAGPLFFAVGVWLWLLTRIFEVG